MVPLPPPVTIVILDRDAIHAERRAHLRGAIHADVLRAVNGFRSRRFRDALRAVLAGR